MMPAVVENKRRKETKYTALPDGKRGELAPGHFSKKLSASLMTETGGQTDFSSEQIARRLSATTEGEPLPE